MSNNKAARNSNIELLRILAMLMIVALHYLNGSMGGALDPNNIQQGTVNYYIANLFETICIISVNIFVLITGYYSIKVIPDGNYSTGIKKPINLYVIMLFYGVLFFIIALIIGKQELSYTTVLRTILPFFYGKRWFVETYIILMLLSPFLNKLLGSLTKRNYIVLLGIWISLFSVWPSFFNNPPIKDRGYGIVHFITLYMIAGFIKLHISLIKKSKYQFLLIIGTAFCMIGTYFLRNWFNGWNYDFILNIISAVFVLIYFLILESEHNRIINTIAGTTFGVFLIHTDISLMHFIYQDILHCSNYYQSPYFIIHFIVSVLLMFVAGAIIDTMRQLLWKITFDKWFDKIRLVIKA